jgi:uncharacterized protein (UPF0147 family)
MAKVSDVEEIIKQINSDFSASNSTKERMKKISKIIKDDSKELAIRTNTCINEVEEMINDPNIDSYLRTQLWNLVSILEIVEED